MTGVASLNYISDTPIHQGLNKEDTTTIHLQICECLGTCFTLSAKLFARSRSYLSQPLLLFSPGVSKLRPPHLVTTPMH